MHISCPLCRHQAALFYDFKQRLYYQCGFCSAIIKDPDSWPDRDTERSRYLEHLNQVEDARFQQFVSPITQRVKQRFNSANSGLDFGAGHAPVITHVLRQAGYVIEPFDPLFFNHPELLQQRYDYICSCEVIEHFHKPAESFALLRRLLNPGGSLFCMTELFHDGIDFHRWNYKNDPTHVFIYHCNTISYISDKYRFSGFKLNGRLVEFSA